MGRYDCVILYNTTSMSEVSRSKEKLYPSTVIREEVGSIEDSLREAGLNPYVLSVDHFSKDLVQTLYRIAPKFVFNLCEEINRDCELEMCVAGLLEMMAIPYTGSGPLALGLALNKFRVKQILRAAGLPVPKGFLVAPSRRVGRRVVRFPVLVKPVHEDASLGINENSVCCDLEQLDRQVAYIHDVYSQEALVEEYLEGREFNVSVLWDSEARVLAIAEIDFSSLPEGTPRIVSYRAKWDEDSEMFRCTVPVCPADVTPQLEKRIRYLALRSCQCIGCRDYARVDMRTDAQGNIYVLEVNPNPDISPQAGFARAARAMGLGYTDMILRVSQTAMERGAKTPAAAYALS